MPPQGCVLRLVSPWHVAKVVTYSGPSNCSIFVLMITLVVHTSKQMSLAKAAAAAAAAATTTTTTTTTTATTSIRTHFGSIYLVMSHTSRPTWVRTGICEWCPSSAHRHCFNCAGGSFANSVLKDSIKVKCEGKFETSVCIHLQLLVEGILDIHITT